MKILVTGFNGKIGYSVAEKLKKNHLPIVCAVRNVEKANQKFGDQYEFVQLDLTQPDTFHNALTNVDKIFLNYPPADNIQFEEFIKTAKECGVKHVVYLSVKDVQFLPFIHHHKNEQLIKKYNIPYTFLRAGYFMQNLNDFLLKEIKENRRIFVPAGKGKTSFVDTRDIAEIAMICLKDISKHTNKKYTITGNESLDFYEVAKIMTNVLGIPITYANPSVKEFKEYMKAKGEKEEFINVVIGVHFPTKLGLAKGIKHDFERLTNHQPTKIQKYIEDYKEYWI